MTGSVAICAYSDERWDLLAKAIDSLGRQTHPPDEVIVVIDHNPGLLDRCRQRWPDLRILASSGDPGLSGARNTALAACHTDIIAFLDDDASADPDWLRVLLQAYGDDGVVAAGGAVVPTWSAGRPAWFPPEYDWVVGCSHAGMPTRTGPVRNLVGANMSFRCDLLRRSGGFRPELGRVGSRPLGCEETEACIRVRRHSRSGRVIYEPDATVFHTVPPARSSLSYFFTRCAAEGRSKAVVSSFVGADEGLSSERSYIRRTILPAVTRSLISLLGGDIRGLFRAVILVAGVAVTGAAYSWALLGKAIRPSHTASFQPGMIDATDA